MKSVFTNDAGKYTTAVYFCRLIVDNPDQYTDEWITRLFPKAYGRSVSATRPTRHFKEVRWYMLIANEKQTTCDDIRDRILKYGSNITADQVTVSVMMAVAERGKASRTGTPRAGTQRKTSNTPHHIGVAAR